MVRYRQNMDVAWRMLDGRAVLVNLDTQVTLMLNEVGSRIWELFEDSLTIEEVAQKIEAEFDAPAGGAGQDVREFAGQMIEKRLLLEVSDGE